MKPTRLQAVKRDLNVMKRGLRVSVKMLIRWINATPDRDIVKRRLLITAGVPAGIIFVGSEYPVPAVLVAFGLFFGGVFWFARVEEQQMTISPMDFQGPFALNGRVVDFEELLTHLVRTHPTDSLQALGDRIHDDYWGPDLTDDQLAAQIRFYGLAPKPKPEPSPTEATLSLSKPEEAGQDRTEGAPEAEVKDQGRRKALRKVMSLASAARSYTGSSTEDKGKTDGGREEQGAGGVDQIERPGAGDGRDGDQGNSAGSPVRDPEEGQEEPGGVPDQDRRDPEEDAPLAEGVPAGHGQ